MAYQTGRLARRRAEYEVAESWFDEAASRALEHRDWETYGRVFIGIGNLHLQRGNLPAAARFHRKAQATGIKHGLSEIQGMAAHDLFVIANRKHDRQEAEALAMAAIRAYGPGHHRLPSIANDLACLWADSGEFERAYSVFRAVLPHISSLRERLLTLGSLARAAGAVADRDAFESAWTAVWEAANAGGAAEEAAEALIGLAQGAANLQDWERAHQAAERAALLAAERTEAMSQFVAESVRDAADARRGLGAEAAPRREDPLVAELIASLDTVPIGA
jgi:tetratricopeptide (TPR) repeat protein